MSLNNKESFLGASNGISGILYQLMSATKVIPKKDLNPILFTSIESTIDRVLSKIETKGYLPQTEADIQEPILKDDIA
jgi:hypothetical protein